MGLAGCSSRQQLAGPIGSRGGHAHHRRGGVAALPWCCYGLDVPVASSTASTSGSSGASMWLRHSPLRGCNDTPDQSRFTWHVGRPHDVAGPRRMAVLAGVGSGRRRRFCSSAPRDRHPSQKGKGVLGHLASKVAALRETAAVENLSRSLSGLSIDPGQSPRPAVGYLLSKPFQCQQILLRPS